MLRLVDPPAGLRPVRLPSEGSAPRVGQRAYAIGSPFGLDLTLTVGHVSAVGREVRGLAGPTIRGMVQTDAAINRGNSGGPLLDSSGALLGVNTLIYSRSGTSSGVGFAVPTATVLRVVPRLIAEGAILRPVLGLKLLSGQVSERSGVRGVIVERVTPGSPVAEAGLAGLQLHRGRILIGDIVEAVDGVEVRTPNDVFHALEGRGAGDTVVLRVSRDGGVREVAVTLAAP